MGFIDRRGLATVPAGALHSPTANIDREKKSARRKARKEKGTLDRKTSKKRLKIFAKADAVRQKPAPNRLSDVHPKSKRPRLSGRTFRTVLGKKNNPDAE